MSIKLDQLFPVNTHFVGRDFEREGLLDAAKSDEAIIIVVYGRRRIGKTELVEQTFRERNLLKLEGVEGGDTQAQIKRVLFQLSKALDQRFIEHLNFTTWYQVFDYISEIVKEGVWTLYFEELQWLAEYKNEFVSDLKLAWDNHLRKNPKLIVVLCGSAPSFMINQVIHSKSLYNRSMYEIHLNEFKLNEIRQYLANRSEREIMDAYLSVGGVPEYLKRINKGSSIQIGICENSFKKNSYFSREHDKIFISSFAENVHYKAIVEYLSHRKFSTRGEIEKELNISSGGNFTNVLNDLQLCGFIEKYTPYNADEKSKLARFCIADNYLRFYYKFIRPIINDINQANFNHSPTQALNTESYMKWLGYAFERFCRKNHKIISTILGFSAVRYESGVYYNRGTDKKSRGYQIDLIFDRADHVFTICEIRYTQSAVGIDVIDDFEKKIKLLDNPKSKTIEKVLISLSGATESLKNRHYFDRIITLENIFEVSEKLYR
ncbi:MAG: ATP-binding protein [Gammaproteobacteria bacterium]|nr:ATP-binding protein [Gammaproteobacteria bacterium]